MTKKIVRLRKIEWMTKLDSEKEKTVDRPRRIEDERKAERVQECCRM